MLQKAVYAGTHSASFAQAARDVAALTEQEISDQRIHRATVKIGNERVAERDAEVQRYQDMPLPMRRQSPVDRIPQVVCVEMDGGRMQQRDRHAPEPGEPVEECGRKGRFWRETKVGVLYTLASETHPVDPCPTIPDIFVDPARIARLCREIKGSAKAEPAERETLESSEEERWESAAPGPASASSAAAPAGKPATKPNKRPGLPVPLVRTVVASRQAVVAFGWLLAAAAWARGFAAAPRKAFLGDGSETIWSVWRQHFSQYTPIVDFIHALCYVYAAAVAGRTRCEAWPEYCRWAQWLWSGEVHSLLGAMEARQQVLGEPTDADGEDAPRRVFAKSLGYLRNQQSRMRYAEYRRAGLPITSSHVESTIKQINRRVKGTEKFWSVAAEAILQLCADSLSDTRPLDRFWHNRACTATGQHNYHTAS
jgi:hypothetical protein